MSVLRDTMSKSLRMECGLGNSPDIFTTNASESINAILKHKVNYKRNELPVFNSKVKELVGGSMSLESSTNTCKLPSTNGFL